MSLTDPISNMLTNIRNACRAKKETVDIPAAKMSERILKIFKEDGYIEDYRLLKDTVQGTLKVYLKYEGKKSVITDLKRISRPGLRTYVKGEKVPRVLNGLGTAVISTPKGVLNDRDARRERIGGEVICYIW